MCCGVAGVKFFTKADGTLASSYSFSGSAESQINNQEANGADVVLTCSVKGEEKTVKVQPSGATSSSIADLLKDAQAQEYDEEGSKEKKKKDKKDKKDKDGEKKEKKKKDK